MKQLTTKMFVLFFGVALLCSSCSKNQPAIPDELQVSFQNMFPAVEFNKDIQVRLRDVSGKTPVCESEIRIQVINASDEVVFLPYDPINLFIRVYTIRDNTWVELKNNVKYYSWTGEDGDYLDPVGGQQIKDFFDVVCPTMMPAVKKADDKEIVRVFVMGERIMNGKRSGVFTGAYIDLFMKRE